jgi:hypothetical protein
MRSRGAFSGADPECAHCREWQQARSVELQEAAQRSQLIELLSLGGALVEVTRAPPSLPPRLWQLFSWTNISQDCFPVLLGRGLV